MQRVAVVMIARDDARHIERALRGVRHAVDDLVVLDLGSRDDTIARARRWGAGVVSATWSDDPSDVWNRALSAANADWHVILEPHEWLDKGAEAIAALRDVVPDAVGLVEVAPGAAGRGRDASDWQPRALPGSVRYAGRYRPEPLFPGRRTWRIPAVIARDDNLVFGWSHDRDLVGAAVRQALAVQPDDPRLLAELGRWQRAEGDPSGAAGSFARAADLVGADVLDRHGYVVETLDALRAARRFTDALALVDAETRRWGHSADYAYVVGDLFFEMLLVDRHKAGTLGPLAEACWRRALAMGDRPELPGALTGRGSFLAAQALGILHATLHHPEEARHWWEKADELRLAAPHAARPRLLG